MSAANKKTGRQLPEIRNSKAGRDYDIGDRLEAGIVLTGTEVKSVRGAQAQISDAYCRVEKGEVFLHGAYINEYAFGNINNHRTRRPRKLLLHQREIARLQRAVEAGGKALIPLRIYFKGGLIKVEIALCTGKKLYDKREDLKKKTEMLEIDRMMKFHR
ncbi:MAG: SsrA-binding protein [Verrucomicrobia bacterium]|nr:MAG: SsrA-binding protein [Verrucomicrobiota bacterium]